MKKIFLVLAILLLLAACAPSTPAADQTPAKPVDTSTLAPGEAFAGLIDSAPADVTWYAPSEIPSDSGVSATIRDNDDGLRLVVDGTVMPVWDSKGVWKMSDGVIAHEDTNPVNFRAGEIGAAGHMGGTTAYVRMDANGDWEVGLRK